MENLRGFSESRRWRLIPVLAGFHIVSSFCSSRKRETTSVSRGVSNSMTIGANTSSDDEDSILRSKNFISGTESSTSSFFFFFFATGLGRWVIRRSVSFTGDSCFAESVRR